MGMRKTRNDTMIDFEDRTGTSWSEVVTNGGCKTGRLYWELEVTAMPESPRHCCECNFGVVDEGCGVPGFGIDLWVVRVEHNRKKTRCSDPDCGGDVTPNYQQWRPHTGTIHLGFYLNCEARSLMLLDCANNEIMYSVGGLSEQVVTYIRFNSVKSGSARLITGSSVTLPQILCDVLNTSGPHSDSVN